MSTDTEAAALAAFQEAKAGVGRHPNLAAALAAFQAELPSITKGETAKVTGEGKNGPVSYKYGYAGLDAVAAAVMPVLGKHGLSVTSGTTILNEGFILEVTLLHESGDSERTAVWPLPDPRRVGPQDLGSAITYGRRYLTMALTGVFPGGEDDDGAKAQTAARFEDYSPERPQQQNKPVSAPPAQPKTSWSDDEVLRLVTPMPTADIEQAFKVYDWMADKGLHKRTVTMDFEGTGVPVTATDLLAGRIADEAVSETATMEGIKRLQGWSTDRGLMKIKVSDTETLAEALFTGQELAAHAAAQQAKADTPDPQAD